jgi:PAS domain S-box-containing protein
MRQIWQQAELKRFMHELMSRPFPERVRAVTNLLGETAVRATGGLAAGFALWDDEQQQLNLEMFEPYSSLNDDLSIEKGVLVQAWQGKAVCVASQDNLDGKTRSLLESVEATAIHIVPIITNKEIHGLLMVFLRQPALFSEDDLALLTLLAEECAFIFSHNIALSKQEASEIKFRELLESAPDAIVIVDPSGHIALINEQTHKLFGYASEELVGQSVECLLPERSRTIHLQHRLAYYANPSTRPMGGNLNLVALKKDGTKIPVEISLSPLPTDEGIMVNCIIRDVTERKEAEAEIRRQAARAQALVQIAGRLGAQFDLEAIIKTVCEETAVALSVPVVTVSLYDPESKLLHYKGGLGLPADYLAQIQLLPLTIYDELAGYQDTVMIIPDIQTMTELPSAMLYAQTNLRTIINVSLLREGALVGQLNIGTIGAVRQFTYDELELLRGLADQATLAIVNIQLFEATQREVAERKRVEEALQENEIYFRSLSQNALDIVTVLDDQGQVKYCSPSTEQILGYTVSDLTGLSIFQFIHPDDLEYVTQVLSEAARTLNARPQVEFRIQHKEGNWLVWEAISKNLLADPVVQGLVLNCQDVTKRKKAEDALTHYSERLASVNEMEKAIAAQSPIAIAQAALMHIYSLLPCQQVTVIVYDFEPHVFKPLSVVFEGELEIPEANKVDWNKFVADEALWRGEIVVQEDLTAVPQRTQFDENLLEQGIRSYMFIPLMAHLQLNGALHLAKAEPGAFTPKEIRVAYEVANPMAVAIEQAQLFQAERDQRELAETLREVTRALSRTLNHREVLQLILDQLARVVDYDGANVMLLSGDKLNIVARKSPDDSQRLTEIEFEALPHVREVLINQRQVVIADTLNDERWQILPNTESIRCWLGTPLIFQDKVIGLLNVNKGQPHFYSEEDVQVVEAFAEQAAIAVENSRLYEQAQIDLRVRIQAESDAKDRASHLTLINDINREIAAVQPLDVALNRAAHLIQQRFGYHHVALFLLVDGIAELKAIAGSYATHIPTKHAQGLDIGLIGWVARWGEKIVANDINQDPHYIPILRDSTQTQAELCIPIKLGGDTLGVLDVQSPVKNAFTDNDVKTLETLADQIALAVDNARLYEALQAEQASLAQRVSERTAELSAANAELARTARSKDEFLANMSHELRTPLNAILSKADIMKEGIYGPLSEKQVYSLQVINESGQHLLDLINDILDVAKIGAGKLTLDLNPVSVASVCDASLRMVKQMAYNKQIEIITEYDVQVNAIEADGRRLKQIIVNLLSNAVKFTPEGGKIGLRVKGDPDNQVAHFTVWDTGIGISPENMRRLFGEASAPRPFMQLDSSLARQFEGTGLGLSLVYSLAELHKGSISVESKLGQGSSFTVLLPWQLHKAIKTAQITDKKEDGRETADISTSTSPSNNVTILLAEDNETNIETIKELLTFEGYFVILARNGHEAIARTEEVCPDLILMDIQMPQMDGLQAIHHIRAQSQFSNIPIIALTALAMPGDRERCLAAGANEYISKPINIKTLMQTIDNQLARLSNIGQE